MGEENLLNKIEELRQKLEYAGHNKNDLQDPEVLEISRELDELLVMYSKLVKNEGNNVDFFRLNDHS